MDCLSELAMYKCKYNQHGGVLLIALIIVAVVSILSGSILYMLKTSIVQNKAIENYNNSRNSAFLVLKNALESNNYLYTNKPISPVVSSYSSGSTIITLTNMVESNLNKAIFLDNLALNNASAVLQYASEMEVTAQTQHQANYIAIINAPSQYRQSDDLIPQTTQNVNVPVLISTNLIAAQLNGSNQINEGTTGYLGKVTVNNTAGKLTYTDLQANNYDLAFPNTNTYQLIQGWGISNGAWYLDLYIYDVANTKAYQTEITLSDLKNLAQVNTFSTLMWTEIIGPSPPIPDDYDPALQYPKGSYITYDNQVFLSLKPINVGINDDPYNNPNDWRLIIPVGTYPQWNTDVNYYTGDIITYNGVQYVATADNNTNQSPPPSNKWDIAQFNTAPWQAQAYNPGDFVTFNGFTFVNVKKSNAKKDPYDQSNNWRIVPENNLPLVYDANIVYTEGLQISYDNQTFVNIVSTSNDPYQNQQNRWRIVIPEFQAPDYNANVRYYKGDAVTDPGTGDKYITNVNYNSSVAPGNPPPGSNWDPLPP